MFAGHLDLNQPLWWIAEDALDETTCAAYIDRFEHGESELAPVIRRDGVGIDERVRNNHRVMWDDKAEAQGLLDRTRERLLAGGGQFPDTFHGKPLLCANPRLRVYRYQPGERHGGHWDTEVDAESGRSRVTLVFYLNEGFAGGDTEFPELDVTIAPRRGLALLFQHRVLHEAMEVTEGCKYVLRTDLIYRVD